jgi:hypothetical protein
MLVRRNGRGTQRNRRLISWPRWVQAWRDDHEQCAAARAEARAHAPVRPGERLLAVARGAGGELAVATDWDLPAVAAERVSWAKVVDQRISLNGETGARVIARRVPGGPQVRWLVVLDQRLDAADPEVRAGLEAAVAELRAATEAGYGAGADPLGVRQRARG